VAPIHPVAGRATLALVLVAGAALAAGCATGGEGSDPAATTKIRPAGTAGPQAEQENRTAAAAARPKPRGPSWPTAMLLAPTVLRARPGGRVLARLRTRTPFGSPVVLAVVRRHGPWLGVLHPAAGNRRVGWIRAARTRAYRTSWSISVSLARRRATVDDAGRTVWSFPVAVGAPGTPTPTGRFAITDKVLFRPAGVYGCCALALTARQPHIPQGWGGGDRIAFHATLAAGTIGTAASHGCLRAHTVDLRRLLRDVPLGSPVTIGA